MGDLTLDGNRLAEARITAQALLDELELGSAVIVNSLMKAKRLARLMRDNDAQEWLDLETSGYPQAFQFKRLGTCLKYATAGGRITPDMRYYLQSLPQYEAAVQSDQFTLQGLQFPTNVAPSVSSSNPNELTGIYLKNAVENLTRTYSNTLKSAKASYSQNVLLFNSLKSAVHSYATDSHHALSFGDAAETFFERARSRVDTFVRATAPKAAEQFAAAFLRYEAGDSEALSHALTSCRRLLLTVADAVFPPQVQPFIDSRGRSRKVAAEDYKNRLLAFLDSKLAVTGGGKIAGAEIEHLAGRVDALYERACKGVHAEVGPEEVRLVLISTYLLLGEVVHLADAGTARAAAPPAPVDVPAPSPAEKPAANGE